jgi:predicted AAA+ superfamily ATPase
VVSRFRNAILGYRAGDIAGMIENIVYLELLRRGFRVSVGRIGELEIDFIAERAGRKDYYQVSYMPSAQATLKRECAPLLAVQDGYPKHLISMDRLLGADYHGVACHYLPEWLCGGDAARRDG